MSTFLSLILTTFALMLLNCCVKDPCKDLQGKVCVQKDSDACKKAMGLTHKEECKGYLKDVAKFIQEATPKKEEPKPPEQAPAPEPPQAPAPTPK